MAKTASEATEGSPELAEGGPRQRTREIIMWYVYIIKCADGIFYTGSTTDIDRRVKEHNAKKGGGCTRGRLPVSLVHKEPYSNRSEAQKREAQIKKWSRRKKLALISKDKATGLSKTNCQES